MKYIGISGSNGFLGSHFRNTLSLKKDQYTVIDLNRDVFQDLDTLTELVKSCDIIYHFAAIIRHENQEFIYNENIRIAEYLIRALEKVKNPIKIVFSSSTQEGIPTAYGRAKREIRSKFESWASKTKNQFCTMIIPNLFGPFAKPYYNSFIATFSHQILIGEDPQVYSDEIISLLHVDDLIKNLETLIFQNEFKKYILISAEIDISVSSVLKELFHFRNEYIEKGTIPELSSKFSVQLFNTFRSYIAYDQFFPRFYIKNEDHRGNFIELIRIGAGGQVSFSTTRPGITRGNHFHTRKIERFSVIQGKAKIEMRKYGQSDTMTFFLDGEKPSYIDIPVWHYHNLINIGQETLYTIFWINEFYDPLDPDTFY